MPSLLGRESTDSERSSSSSAVGAAEERRTKTSYQQQPDVTLSLVQGTIMNWAKSENLRRMRDDGRLGLPQASQAARWAAILTDHDLSQDRDVCAVMAAARAGAEKASGGEWRQWSFLSLQVQLAAERHHPAWTGPPETQSEPESPDEAIRQEGRQRSLSELATELEELRGALKRLNTERDRRCRGNPYADTSELDRQIGSLESRAATCGARLCVSVAPMALPAGA